MIQTSRSKTDLYWVTTAIGLGVWESASIVSRGKIPTISYTTQSIHQRHKRGMKLATTLWLIALGRHLLQAKSEV